MRAGPARDYPVVAVLAGGVEVAVQGCLADYRWCDVVTGDQRGWVFAGNLTYPYQGSQVPVLGYGSAIGLGVLGFTLSDYWGRHYRGRPWYRERDRWGALHPRVPAGRAFSREPRAVPAPHGVPSGRGGYTQRPPAREAARPSPQGRGGPQGNGPMRRGPPGAERGAGAPPPPPPARREPP
jgi:uncharacterized protein YraI